MKNWIINKINDYKSVKNKQLTIRINKNRKNNQSYKNNEEFTK